MNASKIKDKKVGYNTFSAAYFLNFISVQTLNSSLKSYTLLTKYCNFEISTDHLTKELNKYLKKTTRLN